MQQNIIPFIDVWQNGIRQNDSWLSAEKNDTQQNDIMENFVWQNDMQQNIILFINVWQNGIR
jgi:hypothetical protein